MAESPVSEGQVLAGKYRVEKVLGSGGMGVVVAAWHLELEQRVAVKFLHPLAMERPDTAERFRREARSAAKIRSEHVARVIDVGIMEGGLPYMVMEHLDGHDVAEEMQKVGLLSIADSVDFVLQALEALAEAHAAGIVHRDLKPANLFLALRPDGSRIVKVLDFGISKSLFGSSVAEMSLTRTAALIGSPLYMSPEQMRSAKDVDTRTDIWSLGVVLYEMITGRPPYTGDSIPALCASLLNDQPVSMQQLRPDVSPSLEEAVMRCLTKDRQHRFATVSELGRALAPFGRSSSQVHVDRASRVQGATDVTMSAFSTAPTTARSVSPARSQPSPSQLIITPIHGSPPTQSALLVDTPPTPDGTVDSWGRTGGPKGVVSQRSRVGLFAALGVGIVAALGLASFLGARGSAAGAAPSAGMDAKPAPLAPLPPASGNGGVTPLAPSSAATIVATAPPAPGVPEPEAAAKSKSTSLPTKPTSPPLAPSRKDSKSGDLSEFGGRR
jgi:eukaryotic-like serine/threonine-protein kinase